MVINIKGQNILIDDDMYDYIISKKWHFTKDGYIYRHEKEKSVYLHKIIMNCPEHLTVDHINHNKNDLRRENLRICTIHENQMNKNLQCNNTTGYKGVTFNKRANRYIAKITVNRKVIYIGIYLTGTEAADAYNKKGKELFGEYFKESVYHKELDQSDPRSNDFYYPPRKKPSSSGLVGAYAKNNKYYAAIGVSGKQVYLGCI
ncbi:MAG: HNH endonuclease [Treponema sp.]|jgi:hypothetical protein|nr:HNH endonuclease [Treponema sp.]